jgi:K+-transporting ATPase KdpF subunit
MPDRVLPTVTHFGHLPDDGLNPWLSSKLHVTYYFPITLAQHPSRKHNARRCRLRFGATKRLSVLIHRNLLSRSANRRARKQARKGAPLAVHGGPRARLLFGDDGLCACLQTSLRRTKMAFDYTLAGIVAAGLLGYLLYALLRPERF